MLGPISPVVLTDRTSGIMDVYRPLLEVLFDKQQSLLTELQEAQKLSHAGPIFHYTNDVGLFEIMRTGKLWISDYTSMNDPSEVQYGVQIGAAELEAELNRRGRPSLMEFFVRVFRGIVDEGLAKIVRVFVLSMSLNGDELTQWRSYGNNASGYRLEFDSDLLDRALEQHCTVMSLQGWGSFRVLYNENDLRTHMKAYVVNALDTVAQMPRGPREEMGKVLGKIGTDLSVAFIYTALYFKHHAYESEAEYRYLIATGPDGHPSLLHRARRNKFIDYMKMDWKANFAAGLKSIKIGPDGNEKLARKFIADIKSRYLPAGISLVVDKSSIPYRG